MQTMVDYRYRLTAQNLFLSRQLLELVELLGSHGIPALPYKGPVLAAYAYGDVGMRPFSDLDLIVSEADVLRARDLLLSGGYRSLSPRTDSERPWTLPRGYALALRRADQQVLVELHWKLDPWCPLGLADLLPDTRPFPLLDSAVPCLSAEQLLAVLCVHGAKHAWERLERVCGVAHVISRSPDLDWNRVVAVAKALGAQRSVAVGPALAASVAKAPVPDTAMHVTGGVAVGVLVKEVETRFWGDGNRSGDALATYSMLLRSGTLRERARHAVFLGHPAEKDRVFVNLPPRLSFLYFLVRPLRVVHEYAPRGRLGTGWRWDGHRYARRALARQLEYQTHKAATLRGGEDEVAAALAARWARVKERLQPVKAGWDDPRVLEVGSGAHGIVFGSGSSPTVGVDPLASHYARLFPAWQKNFATVTAVGERLPFADGSFDVVLCDNVVDHAEQPPAIVAELARVLAPGGTLYFTVNRSPPAGLPLRPGRPGMERGRHPRRDRPLRRPHGPSHARRGSRSVPRRARRDV